MEDLYNRIVQAADRGEPFDGGDTVYDIDGDLIFIENTNIWIKRLRLRQLNPSRERRTLFFLRCEGIRIDSLEIDAGNAPSVGDMGDTGSLWIDGGSGHIINAHAFGQGRISHIAIHNTSDSEYHLSVDLGEWAGPADNDVAQGIWLNNSTDCKLISPRVTGKGQAFSRAIVGGGNVRLISTDFVISDTDQGFDLTGSNGNIDCVLGHGLVRNCLTWPVKLANSAVRCKVSDVTAENSGAFVASGPSQPDQIHKTQDCEFIRCRSVNAHGTAGFRVMNSLFEKTTYPKGIRFIDCEAEGSTPYGFHSEVSGMELNGCRSVGHTVAVAMIEGAAAQPVPASPIKKQESFPMAAILAALAVLGLLAILIL